MLLSKIFLNAPSINIQELVIDSRKNTINSMFFCLEGLNFDGHFFVKDAIEHGAICIVHEKDLEMKYDDVVYIKVENVASTLAKVANVFNQFPSEKMKVIGITGTNGKTTSACILQDIINQVDSCGYIGTLSINYKDEYFPPSLTTPDPITLQHHLGNMVKKKVHYCAMEVSSHGLELKRVDGIDFDIALFTNLTHDHLDFHGTIENYFEAKAKLFSNLKPSGVAVLNADDSYYDLLRSKSKGRIVTYGMGKNADYYAKNVQLTSSGSTFTLVFENVEYKVSTNLVAMYNIYNLLGVIATLHNSGFKLEDIINRVRNLNQIEGRMERIDVGQDFNVIVDFAHTPDGLEKIFQYVREITPAENKIIAVFGSAGRRDKHKRKVFGEIADKYCTKIVLTEDDPRDEDPKDIAMEIKEGIKMSSNIFIEDRYAAIRLAIESANPKDSVVILGKGNEVFMYREEGKSPYKGDHMIAKEVIQKYYLHEEDLKDENE